jgi:hypothetical protein
VEQGIDSWSQRCTVAQDRMGNTALLYSLTSMDILRHASLQEPTDDR